MKKHLCSIDNRFICYK